MIVSLLFAMRLACYGLSHCISALCCLLYCPGCHREVTGCQDTHDLQPLLPAMPVGAFHGRSISASGGPQWAAPPAAQAVAGQCPTSNYESCCKEATCKEGGPLCTVVLGISGAGERSGGARAQQRGGALSYAGPDRTKTLAI